jgi:hypothetical protein
MFITRTDASLFVSCASVKVRNNQTNRKISFLIHETNLKTTKQIDFRFVSVCTENIFSLFRGYPTEDSLKLTTEHVHTCSYCLSLLFQALDEVYQFTDFSLHVMRSNSNSLPF